MDSIEFNNGSKINVISCNENKTIRGRRSEYLIGIDKVIDGSDYIFAYGIDSKGNKRYGEVIEICEDDGLIIKMDNGDFKKMWI